MSSCTYILNSWFYVFTFYVVVFLFFYEITKYTEGTTSKKKILKHTLHIHTWMFQWKTKKEKKKKKRKK